MVYYKNRAYFPLIRKIYGEGESNRYDIYCTKDAKLLIDSNTFTINCQLENHIDWICQEENDYLLIPLIQQIIINCNKTYYTRCVDVKEEIDFVCVDEEQEMNVICVCDIDYPILEEDVIIYLYHVQSGVKYTRTLDIFKFNDKEVIASFNVSGLKKGEYLYAIKQGNRLLSDDILQYEICNKITKQKHIETQRKIYDNCKG